MEFTYRGVPEKFIKEGVFGYHKTPILIGDTVEAVRNVQGGKIPINTRVKVMNILIEPNGHGRGFTKRISVEGHDGDFNPKRFRKVSGKV